MYATGHYKISERAKMWKVIIGQFDNIYQNTLIT